MSETTTNVIAGASVFIPLKTTDANGKQHHWGTLKVMVRSGYDSDDLDDMISETVAHFSHALGKLRNGLFVADEDFHERSTYPPNTVDLPRVNVFCESNATITLEDGSQAQVELRHNIFTEMTTAQVYLQVVQKMVTGTMSLLTRAYGNQQRQAPPPRQQQQQAPPPQPSQQSLPDPRQQQQSTNDAIRPPQNATVQFPNSVPFGGHDALTVSYQTTDQKRYEQFQRLLNDHNGHDLIALPFKRFSLKNISKNPAQVLRVFDFFPPYRTGIGKYPMARFRDHFLDNNENPAVQQGFGGVLYKKLLNGELYDVTTDGLAVVKIVEGGVNKDGIKFVNYELLSIHLLDINNYRASN